MTLIEELERLVREYERLDNEHDMPNIGQCAEDLQAIIDRHKEMDDEQAD